MKAFTFLLSDEVSELLAETAKKAGISKGEAIRRGIKEEYRQVTGQTPPSAAEPEPDTISKGERTIKKIVERMKEMGLYEASDVPETLVKNIIAQTAGYDHRTIAKYFQILYREMLLPQNLSFSAPKRPQRSNWGLK